MTVAGCGERDGGGGGFVVMVEQRAFLMHLFSKCSAFILVLSTHNQIIVQGHLLWFGIAISKYSLLHCNMAH